MPRCSFCRADYKWPRGVTIVQKDGTIKYYCSGKCRKNLVMGRNNKKLKWTRRSDKESAKTERDE